MLRRVLFMFVVTLLLVLVLLRLVRLQPLGLAWPPGGCSCLLGACFSVPALCCSMVPHATLAALVLLVLRAWTLFHTSSSGVEVGAHHSFATFSSFAMAFALLLELLGVECRESHVLLISPVVLLAFHLRKDRLRPLGICALVSNCPQHEAVLVLGLVDGFTPWPALFTILEGPLPSLLGVLRDTLGRSPTMSHGPIPAVTHCWGAPGAV